MLHKNNPFVVVCARVRPEGEIPGSSDSNSLGWQELGRTNTEKRTQSVDFADVVEVAVTKDSPPRDVKLSVFNQAGSTAHLTGTAILPLETLVRSPGSAISVELAHSRKRIGTVVVGVTVVYSISQAASTTRLAHEFPGALVAEPIDTSALLGPDWIEPGVMNTGFPSYAEWRADLPARQRLKRMPIQTDCFEFVFEAEGLEAADVFSGKSDPFLSLEQLRPVRMLSATTLTSDS